MTDYRIRFYRHDDPEDARRLAQMWNESDMAWPEGFTHGVPLTTERVMQWFGKLSRLAIFVVEHDDALVGCCDLYVRKGHHEVAYIDMLNVSPAHQGKGLGRELIKAALQCAAQHGCKQVTLNTWPGNLNAIPVYKKTGFFWKPDTDVYMQNFIPTALALPVAKPFFDRHDWYRTFQRSLLVQPDDEQWNGIPSYIYEWRAGDERLRLVVDREAEAITAVETERMSVACIVEHSRLAMGLKSTVRWEIVNNTGEPLPVGIVAEGESGILIHLHESATVHDMLVIEREYQLDPEAIPSDEDRPAPKIRSLVLFGGIPIELGTGVRTLPPVQVLFTSTGLDVGRQEKLTINLRSHLPFPVKGHLLVEQMPGLLLPYRRLPFEVDTQGWSAVSLECTAERADVFCPRIQVVVDEAADMKQAEKLGFQQGLRCRPVTVAFRGIEHGKVVGSMLPELHEAVLENETLRVSVSLKGGRMSVYHRILEKEVLSQDAGALGPPFEGWHPCPIQYTARIVGDPDGVSVVLTAASTNDPRLILEKRITLGASSAVHVSWRAVNNSDNPFSGKLRTFTEVKHRRTLALPLREGVLYTPIEGWGEFPLGDGDLPRDASTLPQTWIAWEHEHHTTGIVWQMPCELEVYPEGIQHDFTLPDVHPQDSTTVPTMILLPDCTGWQAVQHWWQRLIKPSDQPKPTLPTIPLVEVRIEPAPWMMLGDVGQAELAVYNRRLKPLEGKLNIDSPLVTFDKRCFEVNGANLKTPFREPLRMVTMLHGPDAFSANAILDTGTGVQQFALPMLKLGEAEGIVSVSEQGEDYLTDNGWMRFRVAPQFGGSMVALETDGVNHLFSAYPEARPYMWFNPWFGGIHPVCGPLSSRFLSHADIRGEVIEETGERGMVWRGVRVTVCPTHRYWRWMRLHCDYLTLPRSNLIAVRLQISNLTAAKMRERFGTAVWCQPCGKRDNSVAIYARGEQIATRYRSNYAVDIKATHWAAVQHRDTHQTLLLVETSADGQVEVMDFGREGAHLLSGSELCFAPYESQERLVWLTLTRAGERLQLYRQVLRQVARLP